MALPDLRHFTPTTISSDPVEALVGEAWVLAIYTDKGWATADGGKLITVDEWRTHAQIHRPRQTPKASAQKERWQEVNSDNLGVYLSLRLIHV
jgi:hypothetical protein